MICGPDRTESGARGNRYDPETPLEETLQALVDIVRMGKALYVGISKYPADKAGC